MKMNSITPAQPKATREDKARARLVIETNKWIFDRYARAGRLDKCEELAAGMRKLAAENPRDYSLYENVQVIVTPPAGTPPAD